MSSENKKEKEQADLKCDKDSDETSEINELVSYIDDLMLKDDYKKNQRKLNSITNILKQPFDVSKLDSNVKKNSAFVKKLKNLTESMKDGVLKDISTLNLTKYLTEVVDALVELKLKASEIPMYLEICSKIHRIYPEFHSLFLEKWQKNLPTTVLDINNYSKLRNDLRIFSELILIGIFDLKDSLKTLGSLLKLLLNEKQSINLSIILNFCKNCGWDYAGLVNKKIIYLSEKYEKPVPISSFLPAEKQKGLKSLLKEYYFQLCSQIKNDHSQLKKKEIENKKVLIARGELSEKKKNYYEEFKTNFQKLWTSVQQLADLLNEDIPELKTDSQEADEATVDKQSLLNIDASGIKINSIDVPLWEDENMKSFYECLPNFKTDIPAHLYKDSIKEKYRKHKKEKKDDKTDKTKNDIKDQKQLGEKTLSKNSELSDEALAKNLTKQLINEDSDEEGDNIEKELEKLQIDSDDEDKNKKSSTSKIAGKDNLPLVSKLTLDELLNSLLHCVTRDTIDKAAYNFCINFNTKSNRKKLLRTLFTCPRTRLDLLSFFARFVAIVNPIMPLIGSDLVYLLKKDFRFHLIKKDQINIESKIKTVRYIGEMTKFNIFPKEETLQCLKILILDFSHHQIEMTCNLLEVCGRFLYLSPSTHIKCNLLLQQMLRKKTLIPMQTKYISMIENAYYNSCPNINMNNSQLIVNEKKNAYYQDENLSNVELYYKFLIQKELSRKSLEKVLNLLFKFDYSNKEFLSFAVKCLSEVCNIKYFNIKYLANCLSALSQYYPVVAHQVIDSLIEDVRIMIEINSIKYNQRRVSVIKYLGELYNYRLIDSSLVIKVLYFLISYNVNPNYEIFDQVLKEKAAKILSNKLVSDDKTSKSNENTKQKSLVDLEEINAQLMENSESEFDTADNLMRIRLICILLDTCVPYMNTIKSKQKLECFILFFQLYFYRKKIVFILNEEKSDAVFPVDIEFMFIDSVKKTKPSFRFSKNYHDAYLQLQKLLEKLVPRIVQLMPKNNDKNKPQNSLKSILEQEEDESDNELEENDRYQEYNSDDNSQDGDLDEEEDFNLEQNKSDDENLFNDEFGSSQRPLNKINDVEDEVFQQEFDKMMSESLLSRSNENIRNITTDIVVPISKLGILNKNNSSVKNPFISINNDKSHSDNKNEEFSVVLMTKSKNNKQLLKKIQVPLDSQLAKSLKEKERVEKEEKERVKKLTLDLNERRELEDEMLERNNANLSLNLNRDTRRKYNHLKGIPDADLIFGYNKKK